MRRSGMGRLAVTALSSAQAPPLGRAAGRAQRRIARAREHLLSLQDPEGWWKAELQTNVTMDAEDLLLREFLGIREPGQTERAAQWIRSQQRADGSWSNFYEGPGDLSTTIEAYVALRLAGDRPGRRAHGGGGWQFIRRRAA